MKKTLLSAAWWKAAFLRADRTALFVAVPYFAVIAPTAHVSGGAFAAVPWLTVGSAAALAFTLSLLTSLAGIAEATGGGVPVALALLERCVKTFAQALLTGIGTNVLIIQDVHWTLVLQAALVATLGSLLLGVLGFLPEVNPTDNPYSSKVPKTVGAHELVDNTAAHEITTAGLDGYTLPVAPPVTAGTPVSVGPVPPADV